jgi:site-specific DNA recombinase
MGIYVLSLPMTTKTPEAQLFANMSGVFAEYERAKILERTARGRVARAKAGHVPGGSYTLGYVYVKHPVKGAAYEVHPGEAALVQRIFRLYVQEGLSQEAIATQLTQENVPTPADRRPGLRRTLPVRMWHQSTVARILHNATYVGTLHYGKMMRVPGRQNPDKKTRWEVAPQADWIAIPVPPLIDEATFEAAQARLVVNAKQSRRNSKHEYLFVGGRLRCGQCGAAMIGQLNSHGSTRYRCCRGRRARYDVVAPHTRRSIQTSVIEPVVWAAVDRALNNPALIAAEVERRKDGTSAQQADLERERQQYQRQLAQCDKDLKRWEAAYLGEAIDLADFKAKKTEVDARRASVERELARLDAEQRLIEQAELETASLMDYCTRVRSELQTFTTEEKRRALEALNITVVWHPNKPLEIQGSIQEAIENHAIRRPYVLAGDRDSV